MLRAPPRITDHVATPEAPPPGPDAPVELALAEEVREILAQIDVGEAPKVPFAAEARPLRQDRQGKDLAFAEQRWSSRSTWCGRVTFQSPLVHQHV